MSNASGLFWDDAERHLKGPDERELWKPLVSELLRSDGGPDAVKEYLEAEQQRLEQRVQDRLNDLDALAGG